MRILNIASNATNPMFAKDPGWPTQVFFRVETISGETFGLVLSKTDAMALQSQLATAISALP